MNCLLQLCNMFCINLRHFQGKERTCESFFYFFLHCLQGTPTAVRRRSPPEIPRNLWPPTFEFATASVCRRDWLGFPIQLLTQELWDKPQGRAGQSSSEHALDLRILQILRIDMSKCETEKPRWLTCDLRSTLSAYSAASVRHSQSHCLGSTMFHIQGNDKGNEILNIYIYICSVQVLCFLWIGSLRKRSPSTQFHSKAKG